MAMHRVLVRTAWIAALALLAAACGPKAEDRLDDATVHEWLAKDASSYGLPQFQGEGRLDRPDSKCLFRRTRTVETTGRRYVLVAVWAGEDRKCNDRAALFLGLYGPPENEHGPGALVRLDGSVEEFASPLMRGRPLGHSVPQPEPDSGPIADQALKTLVAVDPIAAADLPPWPTGTTEPKLSGNLQFEPLTDPATYEAVRASGATVLCWKREETQLKCVASAPRRRPAQIELFVIHGFNDFRSLSTNQALNAVRTGSTVVRKP